MTLFAWRFCVLRPDGCIWSCWNRCGAHRSCRNCAGIAYNHLFRQTVSRCCIRRTQDRELVHHRPPQNIHASRAQTRFWRVRRAARPQPQNLARARRTNGAQRGRTEVHVDREVAPGRRTQLRDFAGLVEAVRGLASSFCGHRRGEEADRLVAYQHWPVCLKQAS